MTKIKKTAEFAFVTVIAILAAVNYTIFVFPNSFAPSGVDGICTMIQDTTNISIGYFSLLVNIPLIVFAFFQLNRDFALKSTVYVVVFSVFSVYLRSSGIISHLAYFTESGTSVVLAPVAAGTVRGILYVFTIKYGASSGGIDIIAEIVRKRKPYYSFMNIIFFLNMLIALLAYFVYGMRPEPVICSIIYAFITSNVTSHIQTNSMQTVKFEIITSDADEMYRNISENLGLPATIMDVQGAYSGLNKKMVICVADKKKAPMLESIIYPFPNTVVFKSTVNQSLHC